MRVISRLFMIIFGAILLGGCVTPYTPEIRESVEIMVINGVITDQEGVQYIQVSRTSPIGHDEGLLHVSNCIVEVQDNKDHIYHFLESSPGIYACQMTAQDLVAGTDYMLTVTTENGKQYYSGVEKLLPSPPIDDILWEQTDKPGTNPNRNTQGVQFFVATDATGEYAKSYRWELEETWEYHSTFQTWAYYDGSIKLGEFPSDTIQNCWRTLRINDFYTYSTRHLTSDHITKLPINHVSDETDRLTITYSLLVKQYSLSETAYDFWKNLEGQSKQTGELYATQPSGIFGNIRSLENPEETVLGYFSASSITEKRILVQPSIEAQTSSSCTPYGLDDATLMAFLGDIGPSLYPVFLFYIDGSPPIYDYVDQHCFDCRMSGGTLERPDYWQ